MQRTLLIAPLTWWEKLADFLMVPVMVAVSGTVRESPQCTHMWNSMLLDARALRDFDVRIMVTAPSSPRAISSHGVRFHVPILGGWREYVVIQPSVHNTRAWHIGWMGGSCGVSRITVISAVRMLRGPGRVAFLAWMLERENRFHLKRLVVVVLATEDGGKNYRFYKDVRVACSKLLTQGT